MQRGLTVVRKSTNVLQKGLDRDFMASDDMDLHTTKVAGLKIRISAWDRLQNISADDNRSHAVLRFVSVALQHQHSITLLIDNKIPSSALALLRCLYDTCMRGVWTASCATPDQAASILQGEFDFQAAKIQPKLQELYGSGLDPDGRSYLHSLTHTGYEQLKWQYSKSGDIEPAFDDEQLIRCIRSASALLVLVCAHALSARNRADLAEESWLEFKDLFSIGSGT
jgi:hypothetical protein